MRRSAIRPHSDAVRAENDLREICKLTWNKSVVFGTKQSILSVKSPPNKMKWIIIAIIKYRVHVTLETWSSVTELGAQGRSSSSKLAPTPDLLDLVTWWMLAEVM